MINEIILILLEAMIVFWIVYLMIVKGSHTKRVPVKLVFSIVAFSGLILLLRSSGLTDVMSVVFKISLVFGLSFFMCKATWSIHLFVACFAVFISMMVNILADIVVIFVHPDLYNLHIGLMRLQFDPKLQVVRLLTRSAFQMVVAGLLHFMCSKIIALKKEYQFVIAGIMLAAAMVTEALLHVVYVAPLGLSETSTMISWALLTACVIMIILGFSVRTQLERESDEKSLILLMNHNISKGYSLLANKNDELRLQAHDFRNHLMSIQNMPEKEAKSYISDLLDHMVNNTSVISSGNRYIDAVFNSKIPSMDKNHIRFSHNIKIPKELEFSMTDLCTIVSNQLDNAIEACCKMKDPSARWIQYTIDQSGDFAAFLCENSIEKGSVTESMLQTTTKSEDKHRHGLGIRSIQVCAERNQGTVSHEISEESFKSKVILQSNSDS